MFKIGIFDDIGKTVSKTISKSISGSDNNIKSISDVVNSSISGIFTTYSNEPSDKSDNPYSLIINNIDNILKSVETNIDDITKILENIATFEGIETPMKKVVEYFIKIFSDTTKGNMLSFSQIFIDIQKEFSTLGVPRKSPLTFELFMEWSNDIFSLLTGIRPYNIIFGKEDWVDKERKGLYYDIVRFIVFFFLICYIGLPAISSFFSTMINQKIKEYYEYEKLSLDQYIQLFRRNIIDDKALGKKAEFLGYDSEALEHGKIISEFYPTPRDLIDFAVREAFEPDKLLFIHEGNAIPKPFSEYGVKVGLNEEWIKRFWHSHWRLLSAGQILEAFHRKLIPYERVLDYLRRLDYTEIDREILLGMSYNLMTRVDVRRLFENGIISEDDMKDYYSTLGFSEKDVNDLTEMSKQLRFIETKDLRNVYIDYYKNGLLDDKKITDLLTSTGLTSTEIKTFLDLNDLKADLDFKLQFKEKYIEMYYNNEISFSVLAASLRNIGITNKELTRIRDNLALIELEKEKMPSRTDLETWLKKNIIDVDTFISYMLRLGYKEEVIIYYLMELLG
ncbi:MAG: hypothetical protein ACFE9S_19110 [Candidatus Hermodarchaeota archaeon]